MGTSLKYHWYDMGKLPRAAVASARRPPGATCWSRGCSVSTGGATVAPTTMFATSLSAVPPAVVYTARSCQAWPATTESRSTSRVAPRVSAGEPGSISTSKPWVRASVHGRPALVRASQVTSAGVGRPSKAARTDSCDPGDSVRLAGCMVKRGVSKLVATVTGAGRLVMQKRCDRFSRRTTQAVARRRAPLAQAPVRPTTRSPSAKKPSTLEGRLVAVAPGTLDSGGRSENCASPGMASSQRTSPSWKYAPKGKSNLTLPLIRPVRGEAPAVSRPYSGRGCSVMFSGESAKPRAMTSGVTPVGSNTLLPVTASRHRTSRST